MNKILITLFAFLGVLAIVNAAPQFENFKLPDFKLPDFGKTDGIGSGMSSCVESLKGKIPNIGDCNKENFDKNDITGYLSRYYECVQKKVKEVSGDTKSLNDCVPDSVKNLSKGPK